MAIFNSYFDITRGYITFFLIKTWPFRASLKGYGASKAPSAISFLRSTTMVSTPQGAILRT
jgi:hypothetical protein